MSMPRSRLRTSASKKGHGNIDIDRHVGARPRTRRGSMRSITKDQGRGRTWPAARRRHMVDQWKYQVRVYLTDEMSETARRDDRAEAIQPIMHVLAKHRATMKCQFDAFADYVLEAEKNGTEAYPLYEWTKETIEDPEKKQKHLRAFAIRVDDEVIYDKDTE